MARQEWRFEAGNDTVTRMSSNVLDAFLSLQNYSQRNRLPSAFFSGEIVAYDQRGVVVGRRTWQGWRDAVLRDTYGSQFSEICALAQDLV